MYTFHNDWINSDTDNSIDQFHKRVEEHEEWEDMNISAKVCGFLVGTLVIGGIILILVCCCKKSRSRGQVLAPPPTLNQASIVATSSVQYPRQQYVAQQPVVHPAPAPAPPAADHGTRHSLLQPSAPDFHALPPSYDQAMELKYNQ